MPFVLDGKTLSLDRAFTHPETGVQYPANWLRHASAEEKQSIGITEVADPERYDERFYWGVGNPKALEDVNEVDENGDAVLDADGNQIVTKGLKSQWKAKQKEIAGSLLAPSDWYVTREAETGVAVPTTISTYRADVRATCGTRENEINGCTTTDELVALLNNSEKVENAQGELINNPEPFITRWPEVP